MPELESSFKGRALFKKNDTSWGIFYPTGYLIATFDTFETAKRARETMLSAGYSKDEVDAVPGEYVVADVEKGLNDSNLLVQIKQAISKAIGTEAWYWEHDLELAKQGAGFLAVRCATSEEAQQVRQVLKPENPQAMRRYAHLVIEELI